MGGNRPTIRGRKEAGKKNPYRRKGVFPKKPTRSDKRWARAVQCYIESRVPLAESHLRDEFLEAFRSFCQVWSSRYNWSQKDVLHSYSSLDTRERRELYLRFVSECHSWESTLRLSALGMEGDFGSRQEPAAKASERESRRQKLRDLDEKEARLRRFHERLGKESSSFAHALRLPWGVRVAFHKLGLPAGAPFEEVKKTYRQLAMKYHPDKSGDHMTMSELNRAYRRITAHYHRIDDYAP